MAPLWLALLLGCSAPNETIWQIGQTGDGFRDLAIPGSYQEYPSRFPRDVTYIVGQSKPAVDWSYVQPGPDDQWAGHRAHPFRVRFGLDSVPQAPCRLVLDFANTHYGQPPNLTVSVNGRTPYRIQLPVGTDDRSLTDPAQGRRCSITYPFASSQLRSGDNEIAITVTSGSWVIYDALRLEVGGDIPSRPDVANLKAESTVLFRRESGRLRQAVHVTLDNGGLEGAAEIQVTGAGSSAKTVSLQPGHNDLYVLGEPIQRKTSLRAVVKSAGKEWSTAFEGRPERQWTVFVGPSAHTDIGYTDLQEKTFIRHGENTLRALRAATDDPAFKWNLEVAFQAYRFSLAHPDEFPDLMKRAREGRIGVQGLYLNMLTGLCSGEELVEAVSRAQTLSRAHGFRVESANLSDVPSSVGTLPMVLSNSGVRYFAEAVNSQRGPVFAGASASFKQSPFWWESFDGSRVLALFSEQYAQASTLGLTQSTEEFARHVPGWLRQFDRPDYPSDAVYVYGAFSDNQPLDPHYSRVAQEWNRTWEYPHVVVGRVDEFFRYVERTAGSKLPVLRGDFGVYWEDGAGSSARETAMTRRARARLETAERWHSLSSLRGHAYPAGAFKEAWDKVLFYDEHTWGAWCSVSQPENEQTKKQWAYKKAYAEGAARDAESLYRPGIEKLAGRKQPFAPMRYAVASNDQSWARDIVVRVPVTEQAGPLCVRDAHGGQLQPSQRSGDSLFFVAKKVPAFAFRTFRVEPGSPPAARDLVSATSDPNVWRTTENDLRFDPKTGALISLTERKSGREWVDSTAGFGLNQFLYVLGGKGSSLVIQNAKAPSVRTFTPTSARVTLVENGPVRGVLRIETEMEGGPRVECYVVVRPGGDLQFTNVVHKPETLELEAGYFAFPFKMDREKDARAFVEMPYGILDAEREQLPGACRDWYSMNSFAAASDGRVTACLSSLDAPLVCIGDIFRGNWMKRLQGKRSTFFSYAFNNYWDTNYRAAQGGDMVFSYRLRLRNGSFDPIAATRFGQETLAAMGDPADAGSVLNYGTTEAWITDSPDAPAVPMLKVAGPIVVGRVTRKGADLLVRLYNPSGSPVQARIRVPSARIRGATRADLAGFARPGGAVSTRMNEVALTVPRRGLETVLIRVTAGKLAANKLVSRVAVVGRTGGKP